MRLAAAAWLEPGPPAGARRGLGWLEPARKARCRCRGSATARAAFAYRAGAHAKARHSSQFPRMWNRFQFVEREHSVSLAIVQEPVQRRMLHLPARNGMKRKPNIAAVSKRAGVAIS